MTEIIVNQWRITGQPDGGYPPYDFTYSSDDNRWPGVAAEACARGFLYRATVSWGNVTFTHRTITYSGWQDVTRNGPGTAPEGIGPRPDAGVDDIRKSLDTLRTAAEALRFDGRENASTDIEHVIHLYEARLAELEADHG